MAGNDYKGVAGSDETFWAAIADMKNAGCTAPKYSEIENSYIEQNNQMVFDNDGGVGSRMGCAFHIHDNRFVVNVTSPRSGQGGPVDAPANVLAYLKSIDTLDDGSAKVHRFWNNEVVYKNGGTGKTWFMDVQAFGNSDGLGLGEIWVYGNLFRNDPSVTNKPQFFFPTYCDIGTGSWRWYWFNNTFDGWSSTASVDLQDVCNSTGGEIYVGKNNVEVFATNEQLTTAATRRVSNNVAVDSTRCGATSSYFNCGTNPTAFTGLGFYRAKVGGGLDNQGTCDPDGDGIAGVDYDGNGTNDTTWTDLAGNVVSCPSMTSPIDIGAIQAGAGADTTPPQTPGNLKRVDRH